MFISNSPYCAHGQNYGTYYMAPHPQTMQPQYQEQPKQQPMPSPTLSSAYLIGSPVMSAPASNVSDQSSASSFSNISLNSHPSPQTFSIATPPSVISPTNFQPLLSNVVCSPGPVVYDPRALQSAWAIPPNMQWQPVWVPQQQQHMVASPPAYEQPPIEQQPKAFFVEGKEPVSRHSQQKKQNRPRCKACCRNNSPKQVPIEDVLEATAERTELMKQLPEFFGEPQLNFEEFVHYAPVFRVKSIDAEMQYFKIPRTTKERELNIPRRLCELFIRTFGPEDAPDNKDFERISPHNHLCDARMAIRSSIVKSLPKFIIGCRNMDEANNIFNLIFRYAGVAMVKSICPNLPQVFTAVVEIKDENDGQSLNYECTGVVSLFNYHLFRRRIAATAV